MIEVARFLAWLVAAALLCLWAVAWLALCAAALAGEVFHAVAAWAADEWGRRERRPRTRTSPPPPGRAGNRREN